MSLTAYMLLVANMGVFSSVVCRRGGSASFVTLLRLAVYVFGSNVVSSLQLGLVNGGAIAPKGSVDAYLSRLSDWCREASILSQLKEIMQTGFAGHILGFQAQASIGAGAPPSGRGQALLPVLSACC